MRIERAPVVSASNGIKSDDVVANRVKDNVASGDKRLDFEKKFTRQASAAALGFAVYGVAAATCADA
jgi:hypothetical protein